MPHHFGGVSGTGSKTSGTGSTGVGRQDPEGGYAPEHKYSKTAAEMRQQGPQYQTSSQNTWSSLSR